MYAKYFKRVIDFCLSMAGLIVLSPALLVLTVLGTVFMGGSPFFIQERPGRDEKIFKLIKFRTMDNRRDKDGKLLPDEARLNKYGRFLRSTSLDELPELINIIKGDMAIVGPRPLLPEYLPYYTEEERHRHDIRPGLTGLAQVNGRSFISWEEIFKYDVEYVRRISLKKDAKIVFKTFFKILYRENIADVSAAEKDKNGVYHFLINENDQILHQPLNVEREKLCREK